jgi:acid phosphatase type 7
VRVAERRPAVVAAVVLAALLAAALALAFATGEGPPPPPAPPAAPDGPSVVAAGDIAECDHDRDEATAKLVDARPDAIVLTLGDNAYPDGREQAFRECYGPTWGRHKARTRPSPGNHEYEWYQKDANAHFLYFGESAGQWGKGYYSFDVGEWHLISLNSNCSAEFLGGCDPGSEQERWLREDLRRSRHRCTLAYWHHPRFSAGGRHGSQSFVEPFWQALYEAGADVVLSGHEHNYQRFAPQTPTGDADPERGIRQFVVGTGGAPLYELGDPIANLEAQGLGPDGYDWRFVPVPPATFTDSGSGRCH